MDKSRVCITQASKLAKQKCVKKTNLLVYEKKPPSPCLDIAKNSGYIMPPIAAIPAKRIRICTGADLRRMCPPKLCTCPPKLPRRGFFGYLGLILGVGIKTGIAVGLVYWTYDIGLWGDAEDTEDLYLDIREKIMPYSGGLPTKRHISKVCQAEIELMCKAPEIRSDTGECLKAPSTATAVYTLKELWNKIIITFFDVITDIPGYATGAYERITHIGENSQCPARQQTK